MKSIGAVLIAFLFFVVDTQAYAWDLIRQPNGYSTLATLGMRLSDGLRVVLTIDYDVRRACQPSLGVLEFRGSRLGLPTTGPQQSGNLRISVGAYAETVTPYVVRYDNGVERLQSVSQSLIDRISSGLTPIQAQIDGGRVYEFPIDRNTQAIRTAQQTCLNNR